MPVNPKNPPLPVNIVKRREPEVVVDDVELPEWLESTVQFFEGLGKARVGFVFCTTKQRRPCMFCDDPTNVRLQCKHGDDVSAHAICGDCRELINGAPVL